MKFQKLKGSGYFLVFLSIIFGYLVFSSIKSGTTYSRTQGFDLQSDPQGFWGFIAFYSILGLLCLALAFVGDDEK